MSKKIFIFLLSVICITDLFSARIKKDLADNKLKPIEDLMAQRVVILMEINKKADIYHSENDNLFQKDYLNKKAGFLTKSIEHYRHTTKPRRSNQQKNSLKVSGGNLYKKNENYYNVKPFEFQYFKGSIYEVPRSLLGVEVFSNGAKVFYFDTAIDIDPLFVEAVYIVPKQIARERRKSIDKETMQKLKSYINEFAINSEMYKVGKKYIHQETVNLVNNLSMEHEYCKYSYDKPECSKVNSTIKDNEYSRLKLEARYVRFDFDMNRIKNEKEKYNVTWHLDEMINKLVDQGKAKITNAPSDSDLKGTPYCIKSAQNLTYSGKLCFNKLDAEKKDYFEYGYFYPREYDFVIKNKKLFQKLLDNEKDLFEQIGKYVEYKIKEIEQKGINYTEDVDVSGGI